MMKTGLMTPLQLGPLNKSRMLHSAVILEVNSILQNCFNHGLGRRIIGSEGKCFGEHFFVHCFVFRSADDWCILAWIHSTRMESWTKIIVASQIDIIKKLFLRCPNARVDKVSSHVPM